MKSKLSPSVLVFELEPHRICPGWNSPVECIDVFAFGWRTRVMPANAKAKVKHLSINPWSIFCCCCCLNIYCRIIISITVVVTGVARHSAASAARKLDEKLHAVMKQKPATSEKLTTPKTH